MKVPRARRRVSQPGRSVALCAVGLVLVVVGAVGGACAQATSRLSSPTRLVVDVAAPRNTSRVYVLVGARCRRFSCSANIVRSVDRGRSFRTVGHPAVRVAEQRGSIPQSVSSIYFGSDKDGWLYGRTLWATHDGGVHWKRLALGHGCLGVGSPVAAHGFIYVTGNGCQGAGNGSVLFRARVASNSFARILDSVGHLTARGNDVLAESNGRLLVSRDSGRTFAAAASPCDQASSGASEIAGLSASMTDASVWSVCSQGLPGKSIPFFSEIAPTPTSAFTGRGRLPNNGPTVFQAVSLRTALAARFSGPLTRTTTAGAHYGTVIRRSDLRWQELMAQTVRVVFAFRNNNLAGRAHRTELWRSCDQGRRWHLLRVAG